MKKMNLLVMSLVSAAALSFTSCSSNDDLANDNAGQAKVDGFYMTLNVQTPKSDGTRTIVNTPTVDATAAESDVTSGTIYLVDAAGNVVFKKDIADTEWKAGKPTQGNDGSTQIKIEVDKVVAGQTYNVYFLAGSNKPAGGMNFAATSNNFFTATKSFASPFADNNNFAMFNQNDADVDGNGYTVTFIKANNNEANPAKVNYKTIPNAPIKVERVVARIDAPTTSKSTVLADAPADASAALKVAMKDAKEKVAEIKLTNYAISNLANKSYVMQTWGADNKLLIPEGLSYYQPTADFGGDYDYKNGGFTTTEETEKNYVFENNSTTAPTTMYFEYQIKLDNSKFTGPADFTDGTFYRYNNVIYTSFTQIFEDYKDVTNLFGEGKNAGTMKTELTNAIKDETELAKFRKDYKIEVFKGGKTYYKQVIKDKYIGYANAIQRNSIYRLNVKNIFNVGAQVPNGEPTENEFYYINVTVSVNPWVLNSYDVDLQ
ncbi:Mfa1 family fimbria major subunit [Segatella copri]|uniref:Mfa1 family fimbria major subunit n=1 Tax=Segatella copri TaxID=165179 RepID=UPI002916B1D6|nr:Mfa1 family fimbria major subunit [Segatella copri]MDV3122753.1 Mfa1 family fimbria major subunit [Segatella copri]